MGKAESDENVPHISAYAGDMNFMVPYVQTSGPPSQRNANGDTILHAAADGWQHRMVEFLVLSGADINAQNKQGDTPLHSIVRSRTVPFDAQFLQNETPADARTNTFNELILRGADISIQNMQGANPLHLAAHEGDLTAIKWLVPGRGKKLIDAVTSKGATALALAIFQEHIACAKQLITFGADVNLRLGPKATTPLEFLRFSENAELRALFNDIDTKSFEEIE